MSIGELERVMDGAPAGRGLFILNKNNGDLEITGRSFLGRVATWLRAHLDRGFRHRLMAGREEVQRIFSGDREYGLNADDMVRRMVVRNSTSLPVRDVRRVIGDLRGDRALSNWIHRNNFAEFFAGRADASSSRRISDQMYSLAITRAAAGDVETIEALTRPRAIQRAFRKEHLADRVQSQVRQEAQGSELPEVQESARNIAQAEMDAFAVDKVATHQARVRRNLSARLGAAHVPDRPALEARIASGAIHNPVQLASAIREQITEHLLAGLDERFVRVATQAKLAEPRGFLVGGRLRDQLRAELMALPERRKVVGPRKAILEFGKAEAALEEKLDQFVSDKRNAMVAAALPSVGHLVEQAVQRLPGLRDFDLVERIAAGLDSASREFFTANSHSCEGLGITADNAVNALVSQRFTGDFNALLLEHQARGEIADLPQRLGSELGAHLKTELAARAEQIERLVAGSPDDLPDGVRHRVLMALRRRGGDAEVVTVGQQAWSRYLDEDEQYRMEELLARAAEVAGHSSTPDKLRELFPEAQVQWVRDATNSYLATRTQVPSLEQLEARVMELAGVAIAKSDGTETDADFGAVAAEGTGDHWYETPI